MLKSELTHVDSMDTSEVFYDGYGEEGEIRSSEDEEISSTGKEREEHKIKSGTGDRGFQNSESQELKKLQRAKRFAIPQEQSEAVVADSDITSRLYKSLGINKETERHYRFNAIHMRGTQHMSTEDVLDYFRLFKPSYVEWINDVSCNVVWIDHISAAKALLNLSKEIKNLDKIRFNVDPFKKDFCDKTENMDYILSNNDDAVDARQIEVAIPPGFWRIGVPSSKSQGILLRIATRNDKKQKNAEKNSEYYKKYGNPHFGNIPGIVSSSWRNKVFKKYKKSQNNNELLDKNVKKNPWGHLAEEWSKLDDVKDARARISLKRQQPGVEDDLRLSINSKLRKRLKMEQQSESSESENDSHDRGKFPKMKMYADEEEKIEVSLRRNKISSKVKAPVMEDLRLKIDRSRRKKEMLDQGYRSKRYLKRFNNSKGNGYNDQSDNDNYVGDDDGEGEDEEKSSSWAIVQYTDLRESLELIKKCKVSSCNKKSEKSDDEDKDDGDDIYNGDFHHRSPLQIEFENDEYFENDSI